MTPKKTALVFVVVAVAAVVMSSASHAAVFTVNTASDTNNAIFCLPNETCSLREAIKASNVNGTASHDDIRFNIPGSGPQTISISPVLLSLPAITNATIDGTTQPGFSGTPLIVVDGHLIPTPDPSTSQFLSGLKMISDATVTSVKVTSFGGYAQGIKIEGGGHNAVEGCVISDNGFGMTLSSSTGNRIGGNSSAQGNKISQNNTGVNIFESSQTAILGNDISSNQPFQGIWIHGTSSSDNKIGGTAAGEANVITGNQAAGIKLAGAGNRNRISGNSISANGGLGIDLGTDGLNPNDAGDLDSPSRDNALQNYPVLSAAGTNGCETTVQWSFQSAFSGGLPIAGYRFEFFKSDLSGGALNFLGAFDSTTSIFDSDVLSLALPQALNAGDFVTATATSPDGSTSEISPPQAVSASQDPGLFNISQPSINVSESVGSIPIVITRTCGSTGEAQVAVTSSDGTAQAGSDYTALSQSVTFAEGEMQKEVSLTILNDGSAESQESLTVTLSDPSNGAGLGAVAQTTITISDDDGSPSGGSGDTTGDAAGSSGGCSLIR